MISKLSTMSVMALSFALTSAALAQSSGSMGQPGSMQSDSMSAAPAPMQDSSMNRSAMPKMSKAQMNSMKRCQAMSSSKMAKNKACARLMQMHPDMMRSNAM